MKRDFGDRPRRFYILLRDPIERVWSYYHHTNGPTRYKDKGEIRGWMEDTTEMNEYYRRRANSHIWTLTGHDDINTHSLNQAIDTLNIVDFGITKCFHHSLMEFQKGNPEIFKTIEYDYKNFRKDKTEMTSGDRSYIYSHVELDMQLYQHAKEKFLKKVLKSKPRGVDG
jgi:hypothetical protein